VKIEYRTPAGTGSYTTLAEDNDALAAAISGFTVPLQMQPQITPLAGGTKPFVQNRGNATWQLGFVVDRTHASADAAALFIATQAAIFGAVLGNFDFKITIGAQVMYFVRAALNTFNPAPLSDKSSLIQYGFTGTNWTSTAP
jgi:hypothetical protein